MTIHPGARQLSIRDRRTPYLASFDRGAINYRNNVQKVRDK